MAGYFTDSRNVEQITYYTREKVAGLPQSGVVGNQGTEIGKQVTTSWRTNRAVGNPLLIPQTDPLQILQGAAFSIGKNVYDTGHAFKTSKQTLGYLPRIITNGKPFSTVLADWGIQGTISLPVPKGTYPVVPDWSISDQNYYGAKFIRETTPSATVAHLSTAFGQALLGEEVPNVKALWDTTIYDKAVLFRRAGNEYLNVIYGWIPFVSDLTELLHAVVNFRNIVDQYTRDSGRIVRRSRTFSLPQTAPVLELDRGIYSPVWPSNNAQYDAKNGYLSCYLTTQTEYKFSGAYTYYLPALSSDKLAEFDRHTRLANHLLGLRLTPSALWELTPWTWLADWFGNVGTVLSNVSDLNTDNLVILWAYLQRHVKMTRQYSLTDMRLKGRKSFTQYATYTTEVKERIKATPYGFGLNPNSFTPVQWSILGDLFLLKAPKSIR
uniref:Maturation n=1 Tax=Leviviridae sp. TaxID=2027243 RepID=A0A514D3F1_9VIRU|nr:MAG: hypothetical protein H1RhizoLitter1401_000004 [Leviviridae sp.]